MGLGPRRKLFKWSLDGKLQLRTRCPICRATRDSLINQASHVEAELQYLAMPLPDDQLKGVRCNFPLDLKGKSLCSKIIPQVGNWHSDKSRRDHLLRYHGYGTYRQKIEDWIEENQTGKKARCIFSSCRRPLGNKYATYFKHLEQRHSEFVPYLNKLAPGSEPFTLWGALAMKPNGEYHEDVLAKQSYVINCRNDPAAKEIVEQLDTALLPWIQKKIQRKNPEPPDGAGGSGKSRSKRDQNTGTEQSAGNSPPKVGASQYMEINEGDVDGIHHNFRYDEPIRSTGSIGVNQAQPFSWGDPQLHGQSRAGDRPSEYEEAPRATVEQSSDMEPKQERGESAYIDPRLLELYAFSANEMTENDGQGLSKDFNNTEMLEHDEADEDWNQISKLMGV